MSRLEEYIELSRELLAELNVREREVAEFRQPIAIVGMACRLPGASGLDAFWRLLESGTDAITDGRGSVPAGGLYGEVREAGESFRWGGFIEGVEMFDAEFFRIVPVEARLLDPQQRLLLETSWEALEDAGIDARRLKGSRTGVYAGISGHDYLDLLTAAGVGDSASLHLASGNTGATAIGRVAFTLGFEGPAVAVDTACSSSLVAVHQAVSGLRSGETDLALAGGVNVTLSPVVTEAFRTGGMLSPDGRCKTFDATANGYVRGEGCGVVALKRLRDAEAAGDRIWGVIRGSAVNHDGASAGLTVPNGPAQERVIGEALARAGLEPWEVDYLEAHGTGTELGDPIEVHAAAAAYGAGRDAGRPLLLGSVKTNIGHLEAAAGVAGLIKVLLSMARGVIPRHLHFRRPNPRVEWERLPVRVVSEPEKWPPAEGRPARAGVSSFGFSGTNAHMVLEGYGAVAAAGPRHSGEKPAPYLIRGRNPVAGGAGPAVAVGWPEGASEFRPAKGSGGVTAPRVRRLLPLSGRTDEALRALAARYLEWLDGSAGLLSTADSEDGDAGAVASGLLADMAWTAGVGRSHHGRREGLTFAGVEELRVRLAALASGATAEPPAGNRSRAAPKVAFLFTGQGSQWAGMGRELYEREPVFRAVLDRCESAVQALRGESLLDVMFGDATGGDLDASRWTQPALYALESGVAALWRSVGVIPSAVLGHSVGEVAAAHAAGVFSLEDGLRFAALRGELIGSLPEGLRGEPLQVSHALHGARMEPVLGELEGLLAGVAVSPPAVDWVSSVTGRVVAAEEELAGAYWRRQAREPAAFAAGVASLAELGVEVLLEVGPQPVLGAMAASAWPPAVTDGAGDGTGEPLRSVGPVTLSSLEPQAQGAGAASPGRGFVEAVALAYEAGLEVRFEGLFAGEERRRLSLPRYPFQRQRYWADSRRRHFDGGRGHALVGARHESAAGGTTFETELYATAPEWLSEHRVFGQVVAPGALYGAMALSAASLALAAGSGSGGVEGGGVVLEDVRIHGPLVLPEGKDDGAEPGRRVQVVVGGAGGSSPRTVAIYSKEEERGEWTLHFEARAAVEAPPAEAGLDLDTLRRGLREWNVAGFYRALAAVGMDFAGSFRTVQELWCGSGEAVGDVRAGDEFTAGEVAVHPMLLDGCFQVVGAALAGGEQETETDESQAYMPFAWERLWLSGALPERVTCRARLRQSGGDAGTGRAGASAEVVAADLWLYGRDGEALGGVSGLAMKRATRAAFLAAAGRTEDLLYAPVWREAAFTGAPRRAAYLWSPDEAASAAGGVEAHLSAEGLSAASVSALTEDLERLSRAYAVSALSGLGWRPERGAVVSEEELRRRLKVVKEHAGLFGRVLGLAADAGVLERVEGAGDVGPRWRVVSGSVGELPEREMEESAALATALGERHGPGRVESGLLARCGGALAEVLRGRVEPLELLFDETGPSAAELYREALGARALNGLLSAAVGAAVSGLPGDRRLRVLEVGAGTGATTGAVLSRLPAGRFEYVYTDLSAGFLAAARERFGVEDGMAYRVLDIEREPSGQGFPAHGYDVVIAANVLHATRDMAATLGHCRGLLSPCGMLVALEGLRGQGWLDLTFGMLEGWWRFAEGADGYREGGPLMAAGEWRRALADAGFGEVEVLGEAEGLPQGVVLARAPAEVEEAPGLWVVALDEGGAGLDLCAELARRNQRVVAVVDAEGLGETETSGVEVERVDVMSRQEWRSLLERVCEEDRLRGVVHLRALSGHGNGADAAELAGDVKRGTGSALALVQGLVDAGMEPSGGLWMVTRGAQVVDRESGGELSGAALWGLGKTVALEAGGLRPRMVDLDPEESVRFGTLVEELLYPDREREVAYRGGSRRVLRLMRSGAGREPAGGDGHEGEGSGGPSSDVLREDGTYLVTGGLGGVGLEVAGWLAERGARNIVLNGRRQPDGAAMAAVEALRERGVEVRVELADVADGEAVAAMLERVEGAMPRLAGIFHSVGVLSDASLGNQDWGRFERVLWPKVLGAWHLHRATEGREPDLFVLFSSAIGVLGNPGQANHAAANAFLDQLARHRRALGLAGQSIAWGAWSGTGEAEEQRGRIGDRFAGAVGWMTPRQGLGVLERVLRGGEATSMAALVDWGKYGAAVKEAPALLEELVRPAVVDGAEERHGETWLERLREARESEREGVLLGLVQRELQAVLQTPTLPAAGVGFFDLGMDSLMAVELRNRLNRVLGEATTLSSTAVFDNGSPAALARHLADELGIIGAPEPRPPARVAARGDDWIAVVGLACRFPGGGGLEGFWRLLESGEDAVTAGRRTPLGGSARGLYGQAWEEGSPVHWGAFIEDVDLFDAEFFRVAPVEARLLDPQHRLLLETSWEALESAGIDASRLKGSRTGVYTGISTHDYWDLMGAAGAGGSPSLYGATGNTPSTGIGRVAFTLGLEGPALAVDTACSSSLVAVHQAVLGLQRGDADLALAGGVNVMLSAAVTEAFRSGGMLSPDGRCKTFDASADGFVRGEGCGVVVLKRLADAEADGDRIWGVIRGSAVNHDGASAGLTVPNGSAQERVIGEALSRAGLEPWEVDYLEAHGTGTELGDPIEVDAAVAAYGAGRDPAHPLLLGSVKTNVGHLEAAAGVAGLIKVLLSMAHGTIPRHLHFREPNPHIGWDRLPVRVVSEPEAWPQGEARPARAGLSSFGVSGTNAHVVIEGYGAVAEACPRHSGEKPAPYLIRGRNPGVEWGAGRAVPVDWPEAASELRPAEESGAAPGARTRRLLALSGHTDEALRALAGRYVEWLDARVPSFADAGGAGAGSGGMELLADAAWTAAAGRSHHGRRAAVTFADAGELRGKLAALASGDTGAAALRVPGAAPKVAFLFTGQGSQWAGMGRDLYEREPVFRVVLDRCEAEFLDFRAESLLAVMFGDGDGGGSLDHTRWTQPALYALEAGLAALWASLGVRPAAVLGHSVGEIAAAYAAGVLSLEEGMRLAARRGELMGSLPAAGSEAGAMAAVFAPPARVEALVAEVNAAMGGEGLSVAAYNGVHQVVSGRVDAATDLLERCDAAGLRAERLRVSHAFHSVLMEPVLEELEGLLAGMEPAPPRLDLVSDVTGRVLAEGETLDGVYWRRQAREPVAFAAGVATLAGLGVDVLVEVGPRPVLGVMAELAWPAAERQDGDGTGAAPTPGSQRPVVLSSLGREAAGNGPARSDGGFVEAVAGAYAAGVELSFEGLFAGEERRRLSLPAYPFQRRRYWTDLSRRRGSGGAGHPLLGERRALPGGETTFETEFRASAPEWLSDHRVFGQAVAPGALYAAMALAAVSPSSGARSRGGAALENVRLHEPLALPEEDGDGGVTGRTVSVVVSVAGGSGQRSVTICSRGEDDREWTLHAQARAAAAPVEAGAAPDLEALKEGLSAREVPVFYRALAAAGVELGESFRTLQGLWSGTGEAVGEVWPGEAPGAGEAGLSPVLLDGCFQVMAAALGAGAEDEGTEAEEGGVACWPLGWERLWVRGGRTERVTCHARLRGNGTVDGAPEWTGDLWLYGADGALLGAVAGLAMKRARRRDLLSWAGRGRELLYELAWRPLPAAAAESPSPAAVLVLDGGGGESPLAALAEAALAHRGVEVSRASGSDPARLLSSVDGIVVAAPAWSGGPDSLPGALGWLLDLVRALAASEASLPLGVSVVTRSGVLAAPGEWVDPVAASLWGLGRSVQVERPALGLRLVDLGPSGEVAAGAEGAGGAGSGDLQPVAQALLGVHGEDQLAVREGGLLAPRLERWGRGETAAPARDAGFREDGSYLVTGGLGYLGLELAEWLAREGARHLVLVGRRGPNEAARERLAAVESETGCRMVTERVDVGEASEVAALLGRFAASAQPVAEGEGWPRLAGVFHAAGVLDEDVAVTEQTAARIERVLRPKALGAWHLHQGTRERELDLFVLYSSISSTWSPPRQGGYAAANAFLDGLAALRRSAGLPAVSVGWGPWGGGGMGRGSTELETRMGRQGLGLLTPQAAHAALERLLPREPVAGVVLDADWQRVGAVLGAESPALLSDLVSEAAAPPAGAGGLLERLREAPVSEREALLLRFVRTELQAVLELPSPPSPGIGFFDLGMDSLMALEFRSRLNRGLSGAHVVSSTAAFDHPSPQALARHLAEALGVLDAPAAPARRAPLPRADDGIAVVGMACRFPGGADVAGFWRLLESGGDAVTEGRPEPFRVPAPAAAFDNRSPARWGGFIEDLDLFDAEFFRIAPVEARLLDPQQRLLLETSWQALESAGIDADRLRGSRTGVYAGISSHDYLDLLAAAGAVDSASLYVASGNTGSTAIGRIAFTLGFEGPALAVDTACSSSLVAVHQAVSALQRGEADLVLAGGVNALLSRAPSEALRTSGALSLTGRCRTFDASADGYVRGEGCGVVVLKRLRDAEAAGDRIWGVIRGSAVNHDGASAGLTVPNGPAQERVIGEALWRAGLEPRDVDYLEAHGTGTELGDPIEVHAAAAAYGAGRDPANPLLLGSVKTNVGHLEAAAGVAGLIKVLLSMNLGVIPKHLHFREPSPHVAWERLPVRVVSEAVEWPLRERGPARAGVSSFGFSGTNAHVVVEEHGAVAAASPRHSGEKPAPYLIRGRNPVAGGAGPAVAVGWPEAVAEFRPAEERARARERRLLPLAGRTDEALRMLAGRYVEWLDERAGPSFSAGVDGGGSGSAVEELLADVAWTAGVGRSHRGRRAAVTFGAARELREKLGGLASGAAAGTADVADRGDARKVAFLFTGQGSQWVGMGRGLYEREPVFRAVLDRCEEAFRQVRGGSLLAVMFGEGGDRGSLDDTRWTQPALYALEAGLAALWRSVGVRPAAVLGHSVGEIAAAYAAGVFPLEAGMRLAARRGELMASLPAAGPEAGAMAAAFAPAADVEALVAEVNEGPGSGRLAMAAYNGGHQVVSGPEAAVEDMLDRCGPKGVRAQRLRVSHGFHSVLMDPILDELEGLLAGVDVSAPVVALVSDVTGAVLPAGEAMDGAYWRRQAREPVAFASGVAALAGLGVDVLLELGPRPVLGGMAALAWPVEEREEGNAAGASSGPGSRGPVVLSSLKGGAAGGGAESPDGGFVEAVADAYASGLTVSFEGLFVGERRRRVSLPGYPFQRQRYWADAPRRRRAGGTDHPLLGARRESASGETTFETELYATEPEWLSEHRVFGQVAAPGAMYGVMALSAASLAGGIRHGRATGGPVAVEDVQIRAPLVLPEAESRGEEPGRTVQVVVSPADGPGRRSVKIYGKGEDEDGWTLHAEARAGGGAAVREAPAVLDVEALKEGLSELDTAEFYRALAALGVEFEGSFRAVRGLWHGPGEAVGEVVLAEGCGFEDGGVAVHPVLLDGCFQVAGAALWRMEEAGAGADEGGITYLPLGWERLWVSGALPDRVACHARQRKESGSRDGPDGAPEEVLSADLDLYGENGEWVGAVSGLVLKRATRAAFLSGAGRPDDLLYAPVWREAGSAGALRSADWLSSPEAAAQAAGPLGRHLEADGLSAPAVSALIGDLERLSRGYAVASLDGLGWRRERGAEVGEEELRRRLKVVSAHAGLFGRVLALAAGAGVLEPAAGAGGRSWRVVLGAGEGLPDAESGDPAALAGALGQRHRFGVMELAVLSRCGGALAEVLRGRVEPLGLLFDEAGPSAADLYRDAPAGRGINRWLSAAVAAAVSELPGERRLRVLEVGAGTGGTTGAVLQALPESRFDYVYTDISAGFLAGAAERFGAETGLQYRVLDIERDPVEQGFPAHGYDVVIAGNVLHATRDIGETLGHCRRLLAPGGLLVALEGLGVQGWLDLTFGMLEGWWRFAGGADRYRPDYPLMAAVEWRRALDDAGFGSSVVLGEAEGAQQGVVLARGPAQVVEPPGLWVVASDDGGGGLALAEALAQRNQRVVVAVDERAARAEEREVPGVEVAWLALSSRKGWRGLLERLPGEVGLRGVVHLGASSGHGCGAGAEELAADVERGTGSALALAQGLLDAEVEPAGGLWLVTRGAQVLDAERAGELAGSALWGLGKTLALEAGQLKPRLVDLDPEGGSGFGGLVEELLYPDRETEVAYRGGSRRVLRLARGAARQALPEGTDWRLVSGADGLLESVRAERVPARAPGSGELRVAVEAAGLNFHDVLVALRLVDADAPLGGEFCGRVLEVGADVTEFSVGDRVVGFAPAAFGPEAVTRAELVARAPAGMPPAGLATVPVVFVTAALAFELAGLKAGERVLVHAGAGGVGLAAIQLAQGLGAEVYATASAPKRGYLASLGVVHVFDSRSTRFGEDVLGATGGDGVDVVLNSLTGEGFIEANLSCLKAGGRFVEIGKRGIWSAEEMRAARPDVDYHTLALDRLVEGEPGCAGRALRGVMERVAAGELRPLQRSVWGLGEAPEAMEYMRSGRHVGKVVLRPPPSAGGLREDATYLVTGGLGGIGLELAGWLADRGAGSIVLNGRRAPGEEAEAAVEALRGRGVDVRVELADVADGEALAAMLERMEVTMPPLAGVFHSVGVLSDAALTNQDWSGFERVLWPKVLGAWRLHRATEGRDLDLFVLFSSLTGVLGNPGQANHAAANAFLDQLARHRRALGLAGQAIAWGTWSGLGEAEEQRGRIEERLAAAGAGWMTAQQGLAALDRVVRGGMTTSVAALVDWRTYGERVKEVPALLEELVAADGGGPAPGSDLLDRLREVSASKREELLLGFVQAELQAVLQASSLPAPGVGFFDLGMDSLMAVEFRNRLNRGLAGACALSSTVVFNHASPQALARHLAEVLGDPGDGPGISTRGSASVPVPDPEMEKVQGLSESDLFEEALRELGEDE